MSSTQFSTNINGFFCYKIPLKIVQPTHTHFTFLENANNSTVKVLQHIANKGMQELTIPSRVELTKPVSHHHCLVETHRPFKCPQYWAETAPFFRVLYFCPSCLYCMCEYLHVTTYRQLRMTMTKQNPVHK